VTWPPEWLPREQNGKVARWRFRYLSRKSIRDFLAEPIRANRIEKSPEREAMKKRETDARIEALFALYNIPTEWDELLQWRQLALCLAGEHFAGCRTLDEGRGGPSKATIEAHETQKLELLAEFDAIKIARPDLSDIAVASVILKQKQSRELCAAVRLTKPKSLVQAMRRLREKNGTETQA
jgi:hypothetical protein